MSDAEDLACELALAAGEHDAMALDQAVERLPVDAVGEPRGGHGARRHGLVRDELEVERLEAGSRRGGTRLVPGEDAVLALLVHEPEALVDLVDDRDRRGERRLAVLGRVAMRA